MPAMPKRPGDRPAKEPFHVQAPGLQARPGARFCELQSQKKMSDKSLPEGLGNRFGL